MRPNTFKARLRRGEQQIGLWTTLQDRAVQEICASSGFDWMLVDGEHSPHDPSSFLSTLQVAAPYPTQVMIRIAIGDELHITRALDVGAQNLLIPHVEHGEHARELAAAMCFPPEGTRGVSAQTRGGDWGRDPNYLANARSEYTLILQVESEEGVRNVDALLSVPGVDAVFIGMADLAASMGHLGQPNHPEVITAYEFVVERTRAAATPLGALTRDRATALRHLDDGLAFVAVGTESAILATSLRELRQSYSTTTPAERGDHA